MAAEQAAGIPLLSHLGCHQIIQPGNSPRYRSHLADEVRHPLSSQKHHDRSLAPMLNSVKFLAISSDSSPEKTPKRKGVRVLQFDLILASHALDSISDISTGDPSGILASELLTRSRLELSRSCGGRFACHRSCIMRSS